MSGGPPDDVGRIEALSLETTSNGSVQAAIARTASRTLALYFSRPVRLFRPAKVNGWQTLRNLASQQGETLSSRYLVSLIKLQGVAIIPKHFIPPMLVNAGLGTVLWTAYGQTSSTLEPILSAQSICNSAVSGAVAGLCQAVVAAPAENVRLLLEQGFHGHSWSCAWKEVFRDRIAVSSRGAQLGEIRQLRNWMHDVGQMAGRGWEGWGWGCAKDVVGFAAFFSIFEISRRVGMYAKTNSQSFLAQVDTSARVKTQLPAIVNGVTLITGGVFAGLTYEYSCRPFEIARRVIYLDRLERPAKTACRILAKRIATEGLGSLFQSHILPHVHSTERPSKWAKGFRTIGRVGPWGIGFLVWETYGSGKSTLDLIQR